MARQSSFPPAGFLILGILSIAASILFVVRAAAVEATAERIWLAVIFGAFGFFWLAAAEGQEQGAAVSMASGFVGGAT